MTIALTQTHGKALPILGLDITPSPMVAVPESASAQPQRPAAIPAPYPQTNAKPLFASHFGFSDTNTPVLRRVY